ncbi:MAG: hypothetical protein VZR95_08310 [Alphaproteobacteria bacterium]
MKFLYIALAVLLIWNRPATAEEGADFGLDDETVIVEEDTLVDEAQEPESETLIGVEAVLEETPENSADDEAPSTENTENSPEQKAEQAVFDNLENIVEPSQEEDEAQPEAPAATETEQPAEENSELTEELTSEEAPSDVSVPEEPQKAEEENPTTEDISETKEDQTSKTDDTEEEDDNKTKEEYEEEISFYIKNLNLSVEQLDMAKYISSDSRLKIEQLLKSIYLLRSQARELEAKSLNDFEAILTEEQREQFHKLRALQEKEREKFEVLHIQPDEEETNDSISDGISEDTENAEENQENE